MEFAVQANGTNKPTSAQQRSHQAHSADRTSRTTVASHSMRYYNSTSQDVRNHGCKDPVWRKEDNRRHEVHRKHDVTTSRYDNTTMSALYVVKTQCDDVMTRQHDVMTQYGPRQHDDHTIASTTHEGSRQTDVMTQHDQRQTWAVTKRWDETTRRRNKTTRRHDTMSWHDVMSRHMMSRHDNTSSWHFQGTRRFEIARRYTTSWHFGEHDVSRPQYVFGEQDVLR